jgi:hypothetical protein
MSDNHPFAMLTIHDDDYTLSVQWLTLAEPMLLIGISSLHNDGRAATISPADAKHFSDAMVDRQHVILKASGIRATPANRGDPFRVGVDISLIWSEFESVSVFVENRDLTSLAAFMSRGGPTAD